MENPEIGDVVFCAKCISLQETPTPMGGILKEIRGNFLLLENPKALFSIHSKHVVRVEKMKS